MDSETFIEYLSDVDDIYKNMEEYNPNKKQKILIVFDNMIADILNIKKNLIQYQLNYSLEVENLIFLLFLQHNLVLLYRKKLD